MRRGEALSRAGVDRRVLAERDGAVAAEVGGVGLQVVLPVVGGPVVIGRPVRALRQRPPGNLPRLETRLCRIPSQPPRDSELQPGRLRPGPEERGLVLTIVATAEVHLQSLLTGRAFRCIGRHDLELPRTGSGADHHSRVTITARSSPARAEADDVSGHRDAARAGGGNGDVRVVRMHHADQVSAALNAASRTCPNAIHLLQEPGRQLYALPRVHTGARVVEGRRTGRGAVTGVDVVEAVTGGDAPGVAGAIARARAVPALAGRAAKEGPAGPRVPPPATGNRAAAAVRPEVLAPADPAIRPVAASTDTTIRAGNPAFGNLRLSSRPRVTVRIP